MAWVIITTAAGDLAAQRSWTALAAPQPAGGQRPMWTYPAASAVIPGAGQLLRGQRRGWVYLGAEAIVLTGFLASRRQGVSNRDRYIDLAFAVARAPFDPVRRDTTFQYFETMTKFAASGVFDTDPGPAFAPPDDPSTFNGAIWVLAKTTFFPDPDAPPDVGSPAYEAAVRFYRSRAVGPGFTWSWEGEGPAFDQFQRAFQASDRGFRRSTQFLGLVLANHLVSAIDAFASNRLAAVGLRVRSSVRQEPGGVTPCLVFSASFAF